MKKIFASFFSLFLILVFIFSSSGEPVSLGNAQKVANLQIKAQKEFWKWQDRSISKAHELTKNGKKLAYVFELEPEGCIVVSPDTDISPVIAFTDKGTFSLDDTVDNDFLRLVSKDMEKRLSALPILSGNQKQSSNTLWSGYLTNENLVEQQLGATGVWGPWLATTWHQYAPYNKYCPIDPSTGIRSVVGCVATALAQICNYWQYPTTISFNRNDDHYISSPGDPSQVQIDEDYVIRLFPSFTALNQLLSVIDYNLSDDISALNFACGIAVQMDYSSNGSGAYSDTQAYNKFGYKFLFRRGDSIGFYDILEEDMKAGRPAQLSIYELDNNGTVISGHSIVADGFRTSWGSGTGEFYHLNFGWGSYYPDPIENCWYLLPTGMPYDYTVIDDGTMNIQPAGTPTNIYVATTGNDTTGDGSQTSPYLTIQKGIDNAFKDCTVMVEDGTYTGTGNVNLNFQYKEITVRSVNGSENCIIDCENTADTCAFIFDNGEGTGSVVDGFTIQNGNNLYGGGIECTNYSSPTITNNVFSMNNATGTNYGGGGIFCYYSSAVITNNTFINNTATSYGGGVYCYGSHAVITNNTFTGNTATSGGGIFINTSVVNLTNNTFLANEAIGTDTGGGGMYCYMSGAAAINGNIIRGNIADYGAGILFDQSPQTITNNVIVANRASFSGGGIYAYTGYLTLNIINCTFADNLAPVGCGLYSDSSFITIKNSIFWNQNSPEVSFSSVKPLNKITISYSDIKGGQAGIATNNRTLTWDASNINSDPLFVDSANGNYHLQNTSPCLGKGTNTDAPTTDLEGNPRPNPTGSNSDMGAYEDMRNAPTSFITLDLLAGWNIVSCPGVPVISDIPTLVFGKPLLPYGKLYNPVTQAYENKTTLEFGKGYWFGAGENTSVTIEYYPGTSLTEQLQAGWNMVGSIDCNVPFGNIIVNPLGSILPYAKWYNPVTRAYENKTVIESGKGYWFGAGYSCSVSMNCASPSPPKQQIAKTIQTSWENILSIRTQKEQRELVFGMHKSASDGFDILYDDPSPPLPNSADGLKVGWLVKDSVFPLLDKSIVREDTEAELELSVELSEAGKLSWHDLPEAYNCMLVYDNKSLDMHKEQVLSLPSGIYSIRILLSKREDLPKQTSLLANYPNPFNPETWIPYELSIDTNVEIMIYSSSGQLVRRLDLGYKSAGRYTQRAKSAYWDGKNEAGEKVSSGVYFYSLQTKDYSQTKKMVISK
jgi:hypothetical protein